MPVTVPIHFNISPPLRVLHQLNLFPRTIAVSACTSVCVWMFVAVLDDDGVRDAEAPGSQICGGGKLGAAEP